MPAEVEVYRSGSLAHARNMCAEPIIWRDEPGAWARSLGIPQEAIEIYLASDVIDLHLDSFIWTRIFGYDLKKRHGLGPLRGAFMSQCDIPRVLEAGITGATWVISTNPFLPAGQRRKNFVKNYARLHGILSEHPEIRIVRTLSEYQAARAEGKHGAFIGIQGGNALSKSIDDLDLIPELGVLRITLVHLLDSNLGKTSSPLSLPGARDRLTEFGRDYVRKLNERKIFVDLAHIGRQAFFDALEVHDASQPALVTHTGVDAVYPHWRNLTDEQLRAIADTGGAIGVMYERSFLAKRGATVATVADHLMHIVKTLGIDYAMLGSDWDGAIIPPPDLATPHMLPRLVYELMQRGLRAEEIHKIFGKNFLRVLGELRL